MSRDGERQLRRRLGEVGPVGQMDPTMGLQLGEVMRVGFMAPKMWSVGLASDGERWTVQ